MKPTLAQLEAFHWIVQLGGVGAAAEKLHLSPPTISVRIRMLERGLDRKLFERRGRRLALTAAGSTLAADAEQLVGLAARISGDAYSRRLRLRLGAFDSFAMVCLPQLLQRLESAYPELTVDIAVENSVVLNRRLNEGELDLAFLSIAEVGDHLHYELLGRHEASWVANPRLGFGRRPITPRDLAGLQIFTHPQPSGLDTLVREWFRQSGLEPARLNTCNSMEVILQLTISGAGVSLLPMAIVRPKLHSGLLQRLATRPAIPPQRIFAAYDANIAGLDVTGFLKIARRVLAQTRFLAG